MIIGSAQLIYLVNTMRKRVRPSVLSWLGWAFLMGTSLLSQIVAKGWQWSQSSLLCSTAGCLAIVLSALASRNFSLVARDWIFLVLGLSCMGIYYWSANAWVTTIFAILADGLLAVPMVMKAWKDPGSERSLAWLLGVVSSVLALIICIGHDPLYYMFPTYLLVFNGGMTWLTRGHAGEAARA